MICFKGTIRRLLRNSDSVRFPMKRHSNALTSGWRRDANSEEGLGSSLPPRVSKRFMHLSDFGRVDRDKDVGSHLVDTATFPRRTFRWAVLGSDK